MMRKDAPPSLVHKILSTTVRYQANIPDQPIWKPNSSGLFTCSSPWDLERKKRNTTLSNTQTWNRPIPFKVSFLVWRALKTNYLQMIRSLHLVRSLQLVVVVLNLVWALLIIYLCQAVLPIIFGTCCPTVWALVM